MESTARRFASTPESRDEGLAVAIPQRQFVAATDKIALIDPIETAVAGMTGHAAEHAGESHRQVQAPEPARRLAEYAARFRTRDRPEATIDFRDEFLDDMPGVMAHRRRIDKLVSTQRGKTVGHHDNYRRHRT